MIANIDTILFKDIDEPGLNTLDVYARRGGYEMLKKALTMEPGAVLDEMLASGVRGRGTSGAKIFSNTSGIVRPVRITYDSSL